MPSQKILNEKQQIVKELTERLQNSAAGVIVSYEGINVENDTKLRAELREADVNYTVVKNTLLRFASKEIGFDFDEVLHGTTALATSTEDVTAPARILAKYAKTSDTFKIKSGFLEGEVIGADKVNELAAIPPKPVLIATVLAGLNATIAGFARVIDGIAKQKAEGEASAEA